MSDAYRASVRGMKKWILQATRLYKRMCSKDSTFKDYKAWLKANRLANFYARQRGRLESKDG